MWANTYTTMVLLCAVSSVVVGETTGDYPNLLDCEKWAVYSPVDKEGFVGKTNEAGCALSLDSKASTTGAYQHVDPDTKGDVLSIRGTCNAHGGVGVVIVTIEGSKGSFVRTVVEVCSSASRALNSDFDGSAGAVGCVTLPKLSSMLRDETVVSVAVAAAAWPRAGSGSDPLAVYSVEFSGLAVRFESNAVHAQVREGGCMTADWERLNANPVSACFFQRDGCGDTVAAPSDEPVENRVGGGGGGVGADDDEYYLPRTGAGDPPELTVATQLSAQWIPALERLVAEWPGRISAAFLSRGDEDTAAIGRLFKDNRRLLRRVDVHIVAASDLNLMPAYMHYPINHLRNIAIRHVRTSHVLYLEADMIPAFVTSRAAGGGGGGGGEGGGVDRTAAAPPGVSTAVDSVHGILLPKDRKTVFVVPVFNADSSYRTPSSKLSLAADMVAERPHVRPCPYDSHKLTNYEKWLSTEAMYAVECAWDYEPYFIATKDVMLLDERFVGCFRDKVSWTAGLCWNEAVFFVSQDLFALNYARPSGAPAFCGGQDVNRAIDIAKYNFRAWNDEKAWKEGAALKFVRGNHLSLRAVLTSPIFMFIPMFVGVIGGGVVLVLTLTAIRRDKVQRMWYRKKA